MSYEELFRIFNKNLEDTRFVACADSQDYQAVVLYLIADPLKVRK